VTCYDINPIVKVFNMDLEAEQSLEGYEEYVYSVAISPSSTMIVSGDGGGEVKVWKRGEVGVYEVADG